MGYAIFDETMVDMTWQDIEKAAQAGAIVLLPTGVIEEHGPHMGLGVDTYCSYLACKLTREGLESKGIRTLIAPPYYWGINTATGSFPGSFTVRKETMQNVLYDILASINRWGFTHVFNINWHGEQDHTEAILEAVKKARAETGIRAYCLLREFDARRFKLTGKEDHVLFQNDSRPPGPPSQYLEIHAESLETGIMAHYFPDHVNRDLAKTLKSTDLTVKDLMIWRQGWSDAKKVTPLGYFGNPAGFDPEEAKNTMEKMGKDTADLIESFLQGDYKSPVTKQRS